MPSNRIGQKGLPDTARDRVGEGIKELLSLQGSGLWVGDLAEMRRDLPDLTEENTTPDVVEEE